MLPNDPLWQSFVISATFVKITALMGAP